MASLIRLAPQLLGGSAVVGFGFAFGRDIYRQTKKHWVLVLLIILLASCLYGLFVSSVWMARNHRTLLGRIGKRLGALILLIVCYLILFFGIVLLTETVAGTGGEKDVPMAQPTVLWEKHRDSLVDGSAVSIGILAQNLIVVGGFVLGFSERRKRRVVWEAEDSNATFFAKHGLELLDDKNMRDSDGNRFELANKFLLTHESPLTDALFLLVSKSDEVTTT